jgi:catechol 2,3-dioxygenase-like lactoylglutathione lyase family enzyme
MKRFHVHVAVNDIEEGIAFYSRAFGTGPTVQKPDYAKWMLEDPRLNFAISSRGGTPGVNHLGFQLDSDEEFKAMHAQLAQADAGLVEEIGAHCCYAKSDKYWVTDPAGIAWETYHTLDSIPVFGANAPEACCAPEIPVAATTPGCCAPEPAVVNASIPVRARSGCCA